MANNLTQAILSVVQYILLLIIVYVIQFLIGKVWEMPVFLDLLFNFIVGIVAIFVTVSEEKMKSLKMIPILRTHFNAMNRINKKITTGAEEGSFKGSLQFIWGIIFMIIYSLFINTIALIIQAIMASINQTAFTYDFLPSFAILLGSVPCAYLKWMSVFFADQKKIEKANRDKERGKAFVGKMVYTAKLWVLFISYLIWLTGEVIFLSTNQVWAQYMNIFVIVAIIYWAFLTVVLIVLRITAKFVGQSNE
jgi:hypothetical protein